MPDPLHAQAAKTPGSTVQTSSGRLRGYVDAQVQVFKGVPYGAPTAGAARFLPPAKPAAWTGVRDAMEFGGRAPQFVGGEPAEMLPTDPREAQSENCLVLNVWTPSTSGRRPVMVWLHGGGYFSGSGSYGIYSGRELARKHDVVSISVNHRLNVFGFLYLADRGGAWAQASNAGMLDIVRALEWVKENIAAFGGDPNNVTIFGQSGGAGKVSTLLAMPAAKGLFHRAIAQSGAAVRATPVADAVKTTNEVLQRLKIGPGELNKLHSVPMEQLLAATRSPQGQSLQFGPVRDGRSLPANPFEPTAAAQSASVPFLTGGTATETTFFAPDDQLMPIDAATLHGKVKALLKTDDRKTDEIIALYKRRHPGRDNLDLFLRMDTDNSVFRQDVELQAERKAAQNGAPVYLYRFEYYSPVRGGRLRAMHCMEIPFVFDNLEAGKIYTGQSAAAQKLADVMSSAWVAFAKTGNPNHPGMPAWTPFTAAARNAMVFDPAGSKLVADPGKDERQALRSLRPA